MLVFFKVCESYRLVTHIYSYIQEVKTMDLKPTQVLFVQTRAAGATINESARAAGVSEMTAHRWLKLEEIKNALQTKEIEIAATAEEIIRAQYESALEESCKIVVQIAKDVLAPAQSRLKAVQMIQERLAPIVQTKGSVDSSRSTLDNQARGSINWSMFSQSELDIILPIFQAAEHRLAGIADLRA